MKAKCPARISIRLKAQAGSMSIIVVGLFLPLLFFLFSLSLDVATYYTDQAKVQAALDETAMYSYRFLPNIPAAQAAAVSYSQRFNGLSGFSSEITDSAVLLRVDRRSYLTFASLVGIRDASLPLSVVSRVRGSPVDSFIVLDTSAAVAPTFLENPWNLSPEWPAAQYLDGLDGVSAYAQTQRCFNPIFSSLKHAASDAYRYLGASSVNALGLGFYTGDANSSLITARTVSALPRLPSAVGEVPFVGFADLYVGPSLCAAAAEGEQAALQYQFPSVASALPVRGNFNNRPVDRIIPGTRSLNPDYAPFLQGDELIWSQAASDTGASGFGSAFRQALLQVAAGERVSGRGGLVAKPARMLLWLSAALPAENGIAFGDPAAGAVNTAINNAFTDLGPSFGSTGLTVFFVVMNNPYRSFVASQAVLQDLQNALIAATRSAGIADGVVTVRVFGIDSSANLMQQLSRWLAIANKTTVVAL